MHLFDDLKRVFVDLDLGSFVEKLGYFIILVVRRVIGVCVELEAFSENGLVGSCRKKVWKQRFIFYFLFF